LSVYSLFSTLHFVVKDIFSSVFSPRLIMPVQRSSVTTTSNSRKSIGFSISDIIKNDDSSKTSASNPSSYLHPTPPTWIPPLPPPPTSMDPLVHYQFQRESALQYLRHSGRLFDGRFTSKFSSLLS
jgi:hypothetical protein